MTFGPVPRTWRRRPWKARGTCPPLTVRSQMDIIRWFEELSLADVDEAGGKGANLGELTGAGFPVPPGFVVTSSAYLAAIEESGVRRQADRPDRRGRPRRRRSAGARRPRRRRTWSATSAVPAAVERCPRGGLRPARGRRLRRGALVGDVRGRRRHLVRRDERHLHQRRRDRPPWSTGSATAGPRCTASGSWPTAPTAG